MNGWPLEAVWDLDEDIYAELIAWLSEQAEAMKTGGDREGSMDMDAVMDARTKGARHGG